MAVSFLIYLNNPHDKKIHFLNKNIKMGEIMYYQMNYIWIIEIFFYYIYLIKKIIIEKIFLGNIFIDIKMQLFL